MEIEYSCARGVPGGVVPAQDRSVDDLELFGRKVIVAVVDGRYVSSEGASEVNTWTVQVAVTVLVGRDVLASGSLINECIRNNTNHIHRGRWCTGCAHWSSHQELIHPQADQGFG